MGCISSAKIDQRMEDALVERSSIIRYRDFSRGPCFTIFADKFLLYEWYLEVNQASLER